MRKLLLTLVSAVLLICAVFFAYWTLSPVFTEKVVFDEMPVGAIASQAVDVVSTPAHPASGQVRIVTMADGTRQIRFENYETLNGPDLFVYLASDLNASSFVNLGRIKGTKGDITYEIPEGIDLSKYPYVLTWCKAFSVLFNSADLSPLFEAEDRMCIQVITPARNTETGEIREFPTPCNVPTGWEVIENDIPELELEVM